MSRRGRQRWPNKNSRRWAREQAAVLFALCFDERLQDLMRAHELLSRGWHWGIG